jgi:serine/threonine protein kinase
MTDYDGWEILEPLGEGGQSKVYLARSSKRCTEREQCLQMIHNSLMDARSAELATAIYSYARPDLPSELGALKVFKIPLPSLPLQLTGELEISEEVQRLRNELFALHLVQHEGLPKLLAANEDERWIVTELFPEGSLERHMDKYKGMVVPALRAFRSLVVAVVSLHMEGFVHRDIKPANIFVRTPEELVLGDLGIVFMPSSGERITMTDERVGPRDYMPPWGDLGERLQDVDFNFDVYMLGKLLWCMIAGRLKLPREYHKRNEFNLEMMFPNKASEMALVNRILDKCLVEEPVKCLRSAQELLELVDKTLAMLDQGSPALDENGKFALPCRVCGRGFYRNSPPGRAAKLQGVDARNVVSEILVRIFICDVCMHFEFFAPGFPEEAAQRGWKP